MFSNPAQAMSKRIPSSLEKKIELLTHLAYGYLTEKQPDLIVFDWSIGSKDPQMCVAIGHAISRYAQYLQINGIQKKFNLTTSCEEARKAEKRGEVVADIGPAVRNIVKSLTGGKDG